MAYQAFIVPDECLAYHPDRTGAEAGDQNQCAHQQTANFSREENQ
jgi:hypothetical protein